MARGSRQRGIWLLSAALTLLTLSGTALASTPWYTITTPHFEVHFREDTREFALTTAGIAEEVHDDLVGQIGYEPEARTHIIVLDDSDVANGFASVFFFNSIAIYAVAPPAGSELNNGAEDWLRLLITHEYSHVLQMDLNAGRSAELRKMFGKVPVLTHPNVLMPEWMIEGYATYQETVNSAGGRGRSALYDMYLRAAALEDEFYTMDEASGGYDLKGWPGNGIVYIYGVSFVEYIAEKFGRETLSQISHQYSADPLAGFDAAVVEATGKSTARLWGDWQRSLKLKYEDQRRRVEENGVTPSTKLTGLGHYTGNPEFSPDGKWIAYTSMGEVFPSLRIIGADGSEDRQLRGGYIGYNDRISWSPDGSKIIYSKLELFDSDKLYVDLYTYDLKKGRETRLTNGLRADGPAWSPDGSRIAFILRGTGKTDLVVADMGSNWRSIGEQRIVMAGDTLRQYSSPAWSPDGTRIAVGVWTGTERGGYQDIWIVSVEGEVLKKVTEDRYLDISPAWSADGRYLVFSSDRDGIFNLYAYDTLHDRFYKLTNVLYGALDPSVSPEGNTLAFVGYSTKGYDIHTTEFDPGTWVPVDKDSFKESAREDVAANRPDLGGYSQGEKGNEYELSAYNPLESLAPKFWYPTTYGDDLGIRFGFLTAGTDALGERSYSLTLASGLRGEPIEYQLEYRQTLDVGADPAVTVFAGNQVVPRRDSTGDYYSEERSTGARLEVPLALGLFSQTTAWTEVSRESWSEFGTDAAAGQGEHPERSNARTSLSLGIEKAWVTGKDRLTSTTYLGGKGMAYRMDRSAAGSSGNSGEIGKATSVYLHEFLDLEPTGNNEVAFRAVASAASGEEVRITMGGESEDDFTSLNLRGYEARAFEGSGGAAVTIEYRKDMVVLHRGSFDKVVGTVFLDAGKVWDREGDSNQGQESIKASYGAEAVFRVVFYRIFPLSMRFGIARPLDPNEPSRFYVAQGFSF